MGGQKGQSLTQSVIGALRVNLGLDSAQFIRGLQTATRSLQAAGTRMQAIGTRMTTMLTAPLAGMAVLALRAGGNFEAGMNRVAAVSGASAAQLQQLSAVAREMGATTQFSASQAADAMGFLAMAGMRTDDIIGALPATLQLAAAAQMDLGAAADTVTNIMAGYGLQVADLGRVNDVLVAAFTGSNTNLQDLGVALRYAGPLARSAGVQFETAAAAIGLMGNAGYQGSMAGTSLSGALSHILNPSASAAAAMQNLGIRLTDAAGRVRPLDEVIEQLAPHADNAGLFMQVFGQRAGPAMVALVSQGAQSLRDLTAELENSGGTAQRIADSQMRGFNGALTGLKSAFEALQIAIADSGLLQFATDFVHWLTEMVRGLAETNPAILRFTVTVAGIAAAVGPALMVIGLLVATMGGLAVPVLAVTGAIAIAIGLWSAWGATTDPMAEQMQAVTAAQEALNVALGTFNDTAAPGAAQHAVELARNLQTQARAALAAAEAQLVLAQAEQESRLAAAPEWIRNANAGGVLNTPEVDAANARVAALRVTLEEARQTVFDLRDSSGAITGALGGVAGAVSTVTVETGDLTDTLDDLASRLGDIPSGASGAAAGVAEVGTAAEESQSRLQSMAQGMSRFLLQVVRGGDAARQAISNLLSRAAEMLMNNALMTLLGGMGGGNGGGGIFSKLLGSLFSYEGGGDTPSGPRSGGLDGRGGMLAVLHPDETVIDRTRGAAGAGGGGVLRIVMDPGPMFAATVQGEARGVAVQAVNAARPQIVSDSVSATHASFREYRPL